MAFFTVAYTEKVKKKKLDKKYKNNGPSTAALRYSKMWLITASEVSGYL